MFRVFQFWVICIKPVLCVPFLKKLANSLGKNVHEYSHQGEETDGKKKSCNHKLDLYVLKLLVFCEIWLDYYLPDCCIHRWNFYIHRCKETIAIFDGHTLNNVFFQNFIKCAFSFFIAIFLIFSQVWSKFLSQTGEGENWWINRMNANFATKIEVRGHVEMI